MTNNTKIKVIPGSRDNFSKLKKFLKGGNIPKLQTSWRTLDKSYLKEADTIKRALDINTWDDYYDNNAIDAEVTNHAKNWTLELLNDSRLYDPSLLWDKKRNATGYENWNTAFNALQGLNSTYFGSDTSKFKYLGPTTWNRHLLLLRLLGAHNTADKAIEISGGQRVYWDGTQNKWVPATAPAAEGPVAGSAATPAMEGAAAAPGLNKESTPGSLNNGDYKYEVLPKKPEDQDSSASNNTNAFLNTVGFPTYPAFNAAKLVNGLTANLRVLDLARLKQVPLKQATVQYDTQTGDYTYQSAIQKRIADNYAKAAQLAGSTSNMDYALDIYNNVGKQNDELYTNAALHQAENDKRERLEATAVANWNNQEATNKANENISNLKAMQNAYIDAKSAFHLKNSELNDQFLTSMRSDYLNYNRIKLLNAHAKWVGDNQKLVDEAKLNAHLRYLDANNITNFDAFKNLYNNYIDENGRVRSRYLGQNGNITDAILSDYRDHYGDDFSIESFGKYITDNTWKDNTTIARLLNPIYNGFAKNAADSKTIRLKELNEIDARWKLLKARWPYQVSGENSYELFSLMNPSVIGNFSYTPQFKSGGEIKQTDPNDRFLKYIEHNHKVTQHGIDTAMKSMQRSQDLLKRDLDALDRETLLLLRSIFK